ncbi:MAG: hypothetical protein KDA69_07975 [Planctomycetaceae bacterium]|nr:hypothetical protein [Planctomycetaceae bacterium]
MITSTENLPKIDIEARERAATFPDGTQRLAVRFVDRAASQGTVLLEIPAPVQINAIEISAEEISADDEHLEVEILAVPEANGKNGSAADHADTLQAMQSWVEKHATQPTLVITFQGVHIFGTTRRVAFLGHPSRLNSIRQALLEASYFELEQRRIEQWAYATWPNAEQDLPSAFEFSEASLEDKQQIQKRFEALLRIRARLSRISLHVYAPHIYPPTLASQIGERLRERTQLAHRHEVLWEQLEVYNEIYEMCAQRVSDYTLTRSANALEWVIIVLLLIQILFSAFDLLTSMGS